MTRSALLPSTRLSIGRRTFQKILPSKFKPAATSKAPPSPSISKTSLPATSVRTVSSPCGWRKPVAWEQRVFDPIILPGRTRLSTPKLSFREVDNNNWCDFERLFAARGGPKSCWCMVWRATATEAKATDGDSRRGRSIRAFANGVPIGLLGYFADEPVAGCSIAPRATSVSMNLTLQYDQVLFILEPTGIARSLARKRVTVIDYPDG